MRSVLSEAFGILFVALVATAVVLPVILYLGMVFLDSVLLDGGGACHGQP
jgi:hypothetical protein